MTETNAVNPKAMFDEHMRAVDYHITEAERYAEMLPDEALYINHEDIEQRESVQPNFTALARRKDGRHAEYNGRLRFYREFNKGSIRTPLRLLGMGTGTKTGQQTLDIIINTGLAGPQDVKNVLKYLIEKEIGFTNWIGGWQFSKNDKKGREMYGFMPSGMDAY